MISKLPDIRIGEAIRHEALAVFPLFADASHAVDYELSDEAMRKGTVLVEEVSTSGSVPDLSVENKGDVRVLFLEGEQLVGAKQNRILNTSVLVGARTKSKIPVSCVERGRWSYRSSHFSSSGHYSSSTMRGVLKASVSQSLRDKHGYRSDQGAVWNEVARQQQALGAASETQAMADTYQAHAKRLDEFREKLGYIERASGLAVAIGGKVVAIDLFDKAATCGRVWTRLLSGAVLEAIEVRRTERQAETADVERALSTLGTLALEAAASVGEGEEHRGQSPTGDHASALVLDGTIVHGSVVCAR